MTEKKIRTELVKSVVMVVLLALAGAAICIGVTALMFLYWYRYTELDALQFLGYYCIFGSLINLAVITFTGERISKYWNQSIRRLKIRIRIMNRRKRDEELDNSLLIFSKCNV